MAVDSTSFLVRFPEFSAIEVAQIDDALAEAETLVDRSYYGTAKADLAVRYMAAHIIASNPLGEYSRLQSQTKNGETNYLKNFKAVRGSVGAGCRVI